ncbi:MAG: efflux RND transporter permease subunit [Alphaproteobacteria bacterium]|nr:efflux RND transporter permease subunit [Alphaproteobacteria bacterium]
MTFSEFFIRRPRFAGVISIVMVLLGLIALVLLPVSQYPDMTPPQIIVKAVYPGASASLLIDTVAIPIENEINGVEGMLYMSSTATDNGIYELTITFNVGTDADMAQVKVENRLEQVKALLPPVVTQEGLSVRSQSSNMLAFLVLDSPNGTYDTLALSDFAYSRIQNPLKRIAGVSDVNIFGPEKSVRIWLNPQALSSKGLSAESVVQAIMSQNTQSAVGSIGSAPMPDTDQMVLALTTTGLLSRTEEFENIVVAAGANGSVVRVKDVARVEMGADTYQLNAQYNGHGAVVMEINQSPNSNSLKIMSDLRKEIAALEQSFPRDMAFRIAYDSTAFVKVSIENIVMTLLITFLLVVLVVYVFLQNIWATFVPMITIPVSLISTFAVLYVIGFDLNILTLFALILAIGLVVDDAIIVVERVSYLMEHEKMKRLPASILAMQEIGSSVIATTLVLLSIFIPVAMMAGITGKIYQQFAVTISTAVFFSSINALTLSPALCALLLPEKKSTGCKCFLWFDHFLNILEKIYLICVRWLCDHLCVMVLICFGVLALLIGLFKSTPTSFLPEEDQGFILANVQLPDIAGINQTQAVLKEMAEKVTAVPGVQYMIGIAGNSMLSAGGENIGMAAIGLDPWDDRKKPDLSLSAITTRLTNMFANYNRGKIAFFAMPAIPGVGTSGGLSFQINALNTNISPAELYQAQEKLLTLMNQNPQFEYAFSTFTAETPHVYLDVDRIKLESYGIAVSDLFQVLQNNMGSKYVNNITKEGQTHKVIVQADHEYRDSMEDIGRLYVLNQQQTPVQIREFLDLMITISPKIIYRFNQYLTSAITANTAPFVSSGAAILEVEKLAKELGNEYSLAWTGLSLQEVKTGGLVYILIALAVIFTYLFLVALYESWRIPLAVMTTNIFAVLGALIGSKLMHQALSIYAQLGIVLLIGLASKNAILIVQFILEARQQKRTLLEAALYGAKERYRAVLMTAFTFILGVLPMILATGAGAASQISMGSVVFFGMIVATMIGILFVPGLFLLFCFKKRKAHVSMDKQD